MTVFALVFLAASVAAAMAGQWLFPARSGLVGSRLRAIGTPGGVATRLDGLDDQTLLKRAGRFFEPIAQRWRLAAVLDDLLNAADMPWRVSEFLALMTACAVGGVVVGQLFGGGVFWLVGAAVGALAPVFKVRQRAVARRAALNDQLPDALMLMVNALRAGNSLTQAMQVVSSQMPAPINGSFGTALQEINYGLSVDEALFRLRERFGGVDMALATTAINIQRETGGNLAEILDNIHNTIRDRQTVQGELRALTAQGRLSGWVLSLLPVGIAGLFFLLNRAYIMTLFIDPRGHLLVGGALTLTVIGMLAIRKIVNVPF